MRYVPLHPTKGTFVFINRSDAARRLETGQSIKMSHRVRRARRRRGGMSLATILVAAAVIPSVAAAAVLFRASYGSVALSTPLSTTPTGAIGGWPASQAPTAWTSSSPAVVSGKSTRLDLRANPDPTSPVETSPNVLRAEVQGGDRTTTDGLTKPRAEVLNQDASVLAGTNPDTANGVLWYNLSVRLAPGFKSGSGDFWTILTQWKGKKGSEPELSLQAVAGDKLVLVRKTGPTGTTPTCAAYCTIPLGSLPTGTWTRLVIGVMWSAAGDGVICIKRDGQKVDLDNTGTTSDNSYCATGFSTLQYQGTTDNPDIVYPKQGIYQGTAWDTTPSTNHTAYYGPYQVTDDISDSGW